MNKEEIKETKEYKKAKKWLTPELLQELLNKDDQDLKNVISKNTVYIKGELEKLQNHPEYQKVVQTKKLLDSGIREALDPYKAAADFAALILKERGVK
jgi:hypothetical protein